MNTKHIFSNLSEADQVIVLDAARHGLSDPQRREQMDVLKSDADRLRDYLTDGMNLPPLSATGKVVIILADGTDMSWNLKDSEAVNDAREALTEIYGEPAVQMAS